LPVFLSNAASWGFTTLGGWSDFDTLRGIDIVEADYYRD
jgi:hypothetical protein